MGLADNVQIMDHFIEKNFPNTSEIYMNLSNKKQGSQTFFHTASASFKGVYNIAMSDSIPKSVEEVVANLTPDQIDIVANEIANRSFNNALNL